MASHSLYRKYRPQKFAELVGQEHVTSALRNSIREDRIGHAYLFSGPRGTGKTTTARILARALNCLNLGADGEPCGTCENCTAVATGTFFDLVELDAASNNGVDAMRELIQGVHLGVGASSKTKVYVIDEVHMLSPSAANALLKTLEEPPAHVVFVLATTDPQKVLPTLRSRTQHLEFTLLSHGQLVDHLTDILGREEVATDPEVLDLIARRAAGSVRDALSLLDQALAVGDGRIDAPQVQAAFVGAPFELRLTVLEAAANDDVASALVGVHDLLASGHDVRRVADDLLRTLRDAFLQANASGRIPYDGAPEECVRLTALAKEMGNPAVVRAIEIMGDAIIDIRGQAVADPRLVLEVAVVRIARREARTREETLLDRVERLEQRLADGAPLSPDPGAPAPVAKPPRPAPVAGGPVIARRERTPKVAKESPPVAPAPTADVPAPGADLPAAAPAEPVTFALDDVIEAWPAALGLLKAPVRAGIQDAQPIAIEDGIIVFGVPKRRFDAINDRFRKEAAAIKDAFASRLGAPPRFMLRAHDFDKTDAFRPIDAATDDPPESAPEADEHEDVDLNELSDAPDAVPNDSLARLVDGLGAEVIDERRRG